MKHVFTYLIVGILLIALSACKKDFLNPYDPATPPDAWTPKNLQVEILGRNAAKLTWEQEEMHIDGFEVVKKINGTEHVTFVDSKTPEHTDHNVLPPNMLNECWTVSYSVRAKAGELRSKSIFDQDHEFPGISEADAGSDQTLEIGEVTTTLSANPPHQGEIGHWSILSGIDGSFSDANAHNSQFTGNPAIDYTLRWKISGGCSNSSDQINITTANIIYGEGVIDSDGNEYTSIIFPDGQEWMAENLKTTKFCNGDEIPNISSSSEWSNIESAAWCYHSNETMNNTTYGKLYNFYTINEQRNICPCNWHVPSDGEWTQLEDWLIENGYNWDGSNEYNQIAKAIASTTHWETILIEGSIGNNLDLNNSSGFTGLPASSRSWNGTFSVIGKNAEWWSATLNGDISAWSRSMTFTSLNLNRYENIILSGLSIRCIKD